MFLEHANSLLISLLVSKGGVLFHRLVCHKIARATRKTQ